MYQQDNHTQNCFIRHNGPKFPDRQALANSADPDQTAPRGSGSSTLFAIP